MKLHRVKGKNWQAEKNPQGIMGNISKKGGVAIQLAVLLPTYSRLKV